MLLAWPPIGPSAPEHYTVGNGVNRTPLSELVATSRAVAEASRRLAKIDLLAALLGRVVPDDVATAVAYLSGSTGTSKLGVGAAAIRAGRDVPPADQPGLAIADVRATLSEVAAVSGAGAIRRRVELLRGLFSRATADEQEFLVRLLFGELRQGALEGVLLDAVARAAGVPAPLVRRAAMLAGDLGPVAAAALAGGAAALDRFTLRVLQPVQPMLADTADAIGEAMASLGDASLEYKLDGARIQVHKAGDEVVVFSRALNAVTDAVPEVVEAVRRLPADTIILDGEVLALKPDGTPHRFQDTMRRFGRRLDVATLRESMPLQPYFFDVLHLDGHDTLDLPQAERFDAMASALPEALVIPHRRAASAEQAEAFLDEALARGHEGVMAKSPAAPYAAGSRGSAWLKVKAVRTLDLVVLAAEWGSGRRTGWLSNLHLGARDPATGGFVMLGKTFKGLTDELLTWQTSALLAREVGRDAYTVYVRPELVVEIAFNDVQTSPHYPGGLALRFARVKRYRPDKTAIEADTIDAVRRIHQGG
jgi:DNA ligase-1